MLTVSVAGGSAAMRPPKESAIDRFLRYVKVDTQSADGAGKIPSTEKQLDLARMLESELKALGAKDVRVSEFGIVYARIPGNVKNSERLPALGLIAHMDTSPDVSGANVKPIIHTNYQGGDIVLPGDRSQIITEAKNPDLKNLIGDDIITADGTTLLGSDDKAGCAEIMTLIDLLAQNTDIKHGNLSIAFTPDEEVGGGIEKFDLKGFGATHAYTVDGKELGSISDETWNAKSATVTYQGKNTHPGTAKGIMVNSLYAMAEFISRCETNATPENTEGRVGFIHPNNGTLSVEESQVKLILRDFEKAGLEAKVRLVRETAESVAQKHNGVSVTVKVEDNYQNMKEGLKGHPELIDFAMEATRRAGIEPRKEAVRGGTDGANLTFKGLPCPDLFTGGHNFHGKLEFNSRRGLEKTTEMLLHLVQIFAEKR